MRRRSLALSILLVLAAAAQAARVPQQRGTSCQAMWDVDVDAAHGVTAKKPWTLTCVDGDPFCDLDARTNGRCAVRVNACVDQCPTPVLPVRALRFSKATRQRLAGFVAPPLSLGPRCGTDGVVTITASDREPVTLEMRSRSARRRGRNRLIVGCAFGDCLGCPERSVSLTTKAEGSDLDIGFSGNAHDFPTVGGTRIDACLWGCDDTTDSTCDLTPSCAMHERPVGAPLPLLISGVSVCVVARTATAQSSGSLDLATGALSLPLAIDVGVYVQTADVNGDNVCPRCTGMGSGLGGRGTCSAGPRRGQPCIVDGTIRVIGSGPSSLPLPQREVYDLSTQCPPDERHLATTMSLSVALTTGRSTLAGSVPCPGQGADDSCSSGTCSEDCSSSRPAKGGINQTCCSSNGNPCFPTEPGTAGAVIRDGTSVVPAPAWPSPVYPKTTDGARLATAVCLPRTGDPTVDLISGLPAPAALLLPVRVEIGDP